MEIKDFREPTYKLIVFFIQLIILIACIWFIEFIYYVNIYPDKFVKEKYEETSCQILDETLVMQGHLVKRYRADFLISYKAAGVSYEAWISGNGLDRSFTTDHLSQQELLNQFEKNKNYTCWYNPEVPTSVVLILRHNWSSTFPLFIPSVIGLIMGYYLLQSIFIFLGLVTVKTRATVKNKQK